MINLTPPSVEGIWEATASSRAVVVVIRPKFLFRAIEEHWGADSSKVEIITQFLIRDPVIETVTLNLAREVVVGFSNSSHFSSAFRRTGFTPTDFRKTWLQ